MDVEETTFTDCLVVVSGDKHTLMYITVIGPHPDTRQNAETGFRWQKLGTPEPCCWSGYGILPSGR